MGKFAFDLIKEFELGAEWAILWVGQGAFRDDYHGAHECTYYSDSKIGKNKATQGDWLGSIKDWRSCIPGI